jgi:hypothetical protein
VIRRGATFADHHLGFSAEDMRTRPFARYWNPVMAPLGGHVRTALDRGGVAAPLLPALEDAPLSLFSGEQPLETGFARTPDGGIRVAVHTDMPDVTPAMIDWWFGWHSDAAPKYKLWHPRAHVHARWRTDPPVGARGRARYVGRTSIVDEYIGSDLMRGTIRFVPPAELGFTHPSLDDPQAATMICARVGIADRPVEIGWLVHHVRAVPGGSEMRSRFWMGGSHIAPRGANPLAAMIARRRAGFTDASARALLVHCAEEMPHLAGFLPAIFGDFA